MNKATDKHEPTPAERLLDAYEALTKPKHVAEWQGEGDHRHIFKRTDLPLLDWLHNAITSDTGGSGGSGKAARERTPLDIGAFALYERIDGRVRSWMLDLGGRVGKGLTPTDILRSWYVLWNVQPHTDHLVAAYASILEGWEESVKDILDPPKRIEITAPCPVCGQEWVNIGLRDDPDDIERVRVLVAVERADITESYAMCKACSKVWLGVPQMRWLRIAIDDAEAAKVKELTA